jgi:tetratricopeptide (TPR) repeat protein
VGTEAEIEEAAKEYPMAPEVLVAGGSALSVYGRYTNALPFIDRALKLEPKDADVLVQKGYAHVQLHQFDKAIEPLTTYLNTYTNDFSLRHWNALMNRAISYLQTDRLDDAEQDYQTVLKASRPMFQIYYGLAEIAWRKQDTNAAIRNYQLYLNSSPANPDEVKLVQARLKQLRPSP